MTSNAMRPIAKAVFANTGNYEVSNHYRIAICLRQRDHALYCYRSHRHAHHNDGAPWRVLYFPLSTANTRAVSGAEMKRLEAIAMAYLLWCLAGMVAGMVVTLPPPEAGTGSCTYETIAARSNLGYFVTCEFFRRRFPGPR